MTKNPQNQNEYPILLAAINKPGEISGLISIMMLLGILFSKAHHPINNAIVTIWLANTKNNLDDTIQMRDRNYYSSL